MIKSPTTEKKQSHSESSATIKNLTSTPPAYQNYYHMRSITTPPG